MKTFAPTSRTSVVRTILTALGIGAATFAARPANPSDSASAGQIPSDFPPQIVVDLIINDSTDPTEANPGIDVDWDQGNDPKSMTFPVPIPASFAPGSLKITTSPPNVI